MEEKTSERIKKESLHKRILRICYIFGSRWLSEVTAFSQPPSPSIPCQPVKDFAPCRAGYYLEPLLEAAPVRPTVCARVGQGQKKDGVDQSGMRWRKQSRTRLEVKR